ncbi:MAG: hypothetical protein ACYCQJ_15425 [Nitrososphaerales archaeon]
MEQVLFSNQDFPSLGVASFTLGPNQKKSISVDAYVNKKGQAKIEFNTGYSVSGGIVYADLERDGESITGGAQVLTQSTSIHPVVNNLNLVIQDKDVKKGWHSYKITLTNDSTDIMSVLTYSLTVKCPKHHQLKSVNAFPSLGQPPYFTLSPGASTDIKLCAKLENTKKVKLDATVNIAFNLIEAMDFQFDILSDGTSLTNGPQNLLLITLPQVIPPTTVEYNFSAMVVDDSATSGDYILRLINASSTTSVDIDFFSFLADVGAVKARQDLPALDQPVYSTILPNLSMEKNVRTYTETSVLVSAMINFEDDNISESPMYEVLRDGVSITNGPQQLFTRETNPPFFIENNTFFSIVDNPEQGYHIYTLRIINIGVNSLPVDFYSFAIENPNSKISC